MAKFITAASVNCPLCKCLSRFSAISTQRLNGVVGKTFVVESEIHGSNQGQSRRARNVMTVQLTSGAEVRPLISRIPGSTSRVPFVSPGRAKLEATKVE